MAIIPSSQSSNLSFEQKIISLELLVNNDKKRFIKKIKIIINTIGASNKLKTTAEIANAYFLFIESNKKLLINQNLLKSAKAVLIYLDWQISEETHIFIQKLLNKCDEFELPCPDLVAFFHKLKTTKPIPSDQKIYSVGSINYQLHELIDYLAKIATETNPAEKIYTFRCVKQIARLARNRWPELTKCMRAYPRLKELLEKSLKTSSFLQLSADALLLILDFSPTLELHRFIQYCLMNRINPSTLKVLIKMLLARSDFKIIDSYPGESKIAAYIEQIAEYLKLAGDLLTELQIDFRFITKKVLENFIGYCPNAKMINLQSYVSLLSSTTIAKLPIGLTSLDLRWNTDLKDDSIQYLPSTLFYLNLHRNTKLTSKAVEFLPPTLTFLDLNSNENFKSKTLGYFPSTLIYLDLGNSIFADSSLSKLPRNLEHLCLTMSTLSTDRCIEDLPKTLTYLDLAINEDFTDICISFLAKTLTYLDLSESILLTDACVEQLPPNLTHLNLGSSLLTNACIANLPRTLMELHMTKATKLTDAGIPFLPPNLTFLNLKMNCNLTLSCISFLPKSLIRLSYKGMIFSVTRY